MANYFQHEQYHLRLFSVIFNGKGEKNTLSEFSSCFIFAHSIALLIAPQFNQILFIIELFCKYLIEYFYLLCIKETDFANFQVKSLNILPLLLQIPIRIINLIYLCCIQLTAVSKKITAIMYFK